MKLPVINCKRFRAGRCLDGHGAGWPSPGVCELACTVNDQIHDGPRVTWNDVEPLPRSAWPMLARVIARLATDADKGVGDTIKRQLGAGGEWLSDAYSSLTGADCGCWDRRAWCNARYPYALRLADSIESRAYRDHPLVTPIDLFKKDLRKPI